MKRGADTNEGKTTSTAVQTVSNEERPLILKRFVKGMGELLQTGGYEEPADKDG